ncbi:putative sas10 domain-containing protein [Medicago truncatula]|nr:something about silencing protein 10 isoform X1 [Medicago truncatula]AES90257.1 Sas10/U3 ribonucleoprotein (UTP) family protein, putative [Medicago truncatula]RHN62265.1 putative sas10 domain-containing protein [Medicago truncatula]
MAKKGGGSKSYQKKKDATTTSRRDRYNFSAEDMDDEIDIFHKQRDIVPLDINADSAESDEDDEMPIFNDKDIDNDETDEDGDEEEDDDDEDDEYDGKEKGFIGQLIRQQKYLKSLHGGDEDGMQDEEDDEGIKKTIVGRKHRHGADNRNFELQSSDDEALKEEEEIAREEQREKAKLLTEEDFDLVEDEDNEKLTFKDASDNVTSNVEDLSALSKEEQMNVLYRSAPELVDWLSELNEAHKQLEFKINPFLSKVKKGEIVMEGGVRYFELKQLILLSYCQAITFYLLLKSEGQSVDHHPVIGRLEEIKELMNQTKQLDSELPVELEDILKASSVFATVVKSDNENAPMPTDSIAISEEQPLVSAESPEEAVVVITKDGAKKGRKVKDQKDHIGVQSSEMLKVRASLEEKLKQKGLYSQIAPKPSNSQKRSRPANGQLATYDDFDDAVVVNGPAGLSNGLVSSKVSPFVNANLKKLKVASGDDDLPKRDAIGERRERHEKRVMAGAGVTIEDDNDDDDQMDDLVSHEVGEEDIESGGDSENEFYKQVEKLQAAKRAAKAVTYSTSSRKSAVPSLPEETADGKRYITSQMSKNRGLTRSRNKDKKNPRKNYKLKHQKAVKNRKGQVQSIRRPNAPYSGESTGINATISRSIRFRS